MSAVGYKERMAACCPCVMGAGMCCPSKLSGTQAPVFPSAIGCWEFSIESFSRNGPQSKRPASPRAVHSCCCRWQRGQHPLTQGKISEGPPLTPELPFELVDAMVVTALQPNSSLIQFYLSYSFPGAYPEGKPRNVSASRSLSYSLVPRAQPNRLCICWSYKSWPLCV